MDHGRLGEWSLLWCQPQEQCCRSIYLLRFVTAVIKGGPNKWAIRGGNDASGAVSTYYNGARPSASGYNSMSKEGAIVLVSAATTSNGAQGTFYEGVMTSGYPSDATENSVQDNVVAAKYATTSLTSGPAFTVGSSISLRATTRGYDTRYVTHTGATVNTQVVTSSSATALSSKQAGLFVPASATALVSPSSPRTLLAASSGTTISSS